LSMLFLNPKCTLSTVPYNYAMCGQSPIISKTVISPWTLYLLMLWLATFTHTDAPPPWTLVFGLMIYSVHKNLNNMASDAVSNCAFTLIAISNLCLSNSDWCSFAIGLWQCISLYNIARLKPTPIHSKKFLAAICEKYIFHNRDNLDVQVHDFTVQTNDNLKCKGESDQSTPQSKHAWTNNQVTCMNINCRQKGHTFANCLTYGGGNVGGYIPKWQGSLNLHLPLS
jgi:hypothetical protein